jgi:hypothetical protein
MDAQADLESERRKNVAAVAEARHLQALVDDFKARAALQAAERAELSNAKIQAQAAARRAERSVVDLEDDLKEHQTLSDFLEEKVIELTKELAGRSQAGPSGAGQLEEAYAENKRLRTELAQTDRDAKNRLHEAEEASKIRIRELEGQGAVLEQRIADLEREKGRVPELEERARSAQDEVRTPLLP